MKILIKNKDWILSPDEDYKKVFQRPIWSENPPPDLNGSDKRCCSRFNKRGYCFKNCNRSYIHNVGPQIRCQLHMPQRHCLHIPQANLWRFTMSTPLVLHVGDNHQPVQQHSCQRWLGPIQNTQLTPRTNPKTKHFGRQHSFCNSLTRWRICDPYQTRKGWLLHWRPYPLHPTLRRQHWTSRQRCTTCHAHNMPRSSPKRTHTSRRPSLFP